MARSLSCAKVFSAVVVENVKLAINRRGFAAASQGMMSKVVRRGNGRMGKAAAEEIGTAAENSWIPDPVTGYYRPANRSQEIDAADLREMLLKHKIRAQ